MDGSQGNLQGVQEINRSKLLGARRASEGGSSAKSQRRQDQLQLVPLKGDDNWDTPRSHDQHHEVLEGDS